MIVEVKDHFRFVKVIIKKIIIEGKAPVTKKSKKADGETEVEEEEMGDEEKEEEKSNADAGKYNFIMLSA